jgi:O-antigen/teichoic acid export membrane protein
MAPQPTSLADTTPNVARVAPANGLSLGQNFAWALTGNIIYALCQWGVIVVLARLGNPFMVGQFALGLAIATPVLQLTNLQLRIVQATDVKGAYTFAEYLGLRTLTTPLGVIAIVLASRLLAHDPKTMMVVLAVAIAKAIESLSDVVQGLFQLNDRLDKVGTSMVLRGALSLPALTLTLYFTRDVLWGVLAMAMSWLVVFVFFDLRRGRRFLPDAETGWRALRPKYHFRRQWTLTRLAFPLGIVMTLISFNMNLPRYFVESHLGVTTLGVFSTMAYALAGLFTVVDAMTHSAIPKLSRLYGDGNLAGFRKLLAKVAGMGLALGLSATLAVWVGGSMLLSILYGAAYATYGPAFVWLTAGAGITAVAMMVTAGLSSAQRFPVQVPIFVTVVGANALACAILVPRFGINGAAFAPLITAALHLILATIILAWVLSRAAKNGEHAESAPSYSDPWESGL